MAVEVMSAEPASLENVDSKVEYNRFERNRVTPKEDTLR